jgi:hypothetical protein
MHCVYLWEWDKGERDRWGWEDLAVFQHSSLLELGIATNHGSLDWTTISNSNMVHDNWINHLQLQKI